MRTLLLFARSAFQAIALHIERQPRIYGLVAAASLLTLWLLVCIVMPPARFPAGALIDIPEDASFGQTADQFEAEGIVSSSFALRVLARLTGSDTSVNAGRYLFEKPLSLVSVLSRIVKGEHGLPTVRVTLPEGSSTREMGRILAGALAGFDEAKWDAAAGPLEGYVFPDTYDFYKDASAEEVLARMLETFDARTKDLRAEAEAAGKDFADIVIMASLIEKEANTEEARHIVSGILWSRIEEGVALQVDAVFPYIRGNPDHVPTGDDPELDSPYNTYLNRGLPPGPISNPGLDAIDAALHPTETDYFYYLTGKDGNMYYAESFEGHKKNRELHLD